jgi:TadE-like protein
MNNHMRRNTYNSERGVATIEFALMSGSFLMMMVAVVAGGHFFWTHNAMVESTRRGARYAATQCRPGSIGCNSSNTISNIENVVLYGSPTPPAGLRPLVANLARTNIVISYSKRDGSPDTEFFGVAQGTVSVRIQGYSYHFPFAPTAFQMPPYETTVRGESAGYLAGTNLCEVPTATPSPTPTPTSTPTPVP